MLVTITSVGKKYVNKMAMFDDIAKDLKSLQFESSLTDEERKLCDLRVKSLVVTTTACAQAAYIVNIFNKIRQNSKLQSEVEFVKVGLIGCGRIGKQLVQVLLEYIPADTLHVSTRCPENIEQFANKGVYCCFDNKKVASTVDILFLCCLPSQLPEVAKDIRGHFGSCFVYSFIGGLSLARISQLLDHKQVLKPDLIFNFDNKELSNPWKLGKQITDVLQDDECILHTCPLYTDHCNGKQDIKLCEIYVLAAFNYCLMLSLEVNNALRLSSSVIFGSEDYSEILSPSIEYILATNGEMTKSEQKNASLNLVELSLMGTLLRKTLQDDKTLQQAFVTTYKKTLERSQQV